jgi:PAS domain S-box-containing protein
MNTKHTGMDLENPAHVLQAIRNVQALFIKEFDPATTFSAALNTMIEITDSEFGFLDEVLSGENGEPCKLNLAMSNIAWDDESMRLYRDLSARRLEFRNLSNLAGLPVLEQKVIISNDADRDPRSGGVPEGHPPIHTYMGIPMFSGGEVVGVAGLANREGGYSEEMAVLLEPLLTSFTGIILAARVKRSEMELLKTLRANEETFRTVADFTYDWEYWVSPEGGFIYMSPSCQRISGYRAEEFLEDPDLMLRIVHHDDRDAVLKHLGKKNKTRSGNESLDYRIITREGEERWINHYSVPIFRKDGAYLGLRASCRDITERKQTEKELLSQHTYLEDLVKERTVELERRNRELVKAIADHEKAEAALRESEARYRLLAANASDVIFTLDMDLHFTYISPSVTRIRGYSIEEAMAQTTAEALTPASLEVAMKVFLEELELASSDSMEHWRPRTMELEETCKNGRTIWTETTFSFLRDEEQRPVGILGITRDISKRKQEEEERKNLMSRLALTQKMEALGKFAGGIVHDLNNFLYPILVNTQMLLEESTPNSQFHQTLSQSLYAIYKLRDLIRQVLSFSRSGEQQFTPVYVKTLVKETIAMLKSNFPTRVRIKQDLNCPVDRVLGDPTQIQQIIMNLCMNAVDSLKAQTGKVEVKLENMHLDPLQDHSELKAGEYLCLSVKDSGIGMTEEVLEHIFEPFFTTKEIGKGTGMGLAIIHGIIRSHGGAITVESEPGKGSQFNVYLPLIQGEYHTESHPVTQAKGNRTILLVDDEDIILKSIQRVMKGFGFDVITVKSGLEAIEVFSRIPECIDLVVTDMTMPGMTGIELTRKLIDVRSDIPIILCTGFNDAVNPQRARSMGIKGVLEKPADINELKSAIDQALDHESQMKGHATSTV